MARAPSGEVTSGLGLLQKIALGSLGVVLAGSVALRALRGPAEPPSAGTPAGAQGFAAAASEEEEPEPFDLDRLLPYVTEASLFGLIGFALGYTSRKLVRLALILIALGFVAVQVVVHFGWLQVDWSGLLAKLNDWVLNLEPVGSPREFLTQRVPSAGALLAGWLVGFRRG